MKDGKKGSKGVLSRVSKDLPSLFKAIYLSFTPLLQDGFTTHAREILALAHRTLFVFLPASYKIRRLRKCLCTERKSLCMYSIIL